MVNHININKICLFILYLLILLIMIYYLLIIDYILYFLPIVEKNSYNRAKQV